MFVRQKNSPRCERRTGDVIIKQVQKWEQMRENVTQKFIWGGGETNIKSYEGYEIVESYDRPCPKGTHQMVITLRIYIKYHPHTDSIAAF